MLPVRFNAVIRRTQRYEGIVARSPACSAQRPDRLRQRKLLATGLRQRSAHRGYAPAPPDVDKCAAARARAAARAPRARAVAETRCHTVAAATKRCSADRLRSRAAPAQRRPGRWIRLQRPASSRPNRAIRRPRAASLRLRSSGNSSARNPAKLSALTSPAATSSARALSAWAASRPAPCRSSSKNEAPKRCRCSAMARAPPDRRGEARLDRLGTEARHVLPQGPPLAREQRDGG